MPGISNILWGRPGIAIALLTAIAIMPSPVTAFDCTGRVNDSLKNPLGNVIVQLYEPENGTLMYSSQSDAAGYFAFSAISDMHYQIRVSGSSYPDQWFSFYQNTLNRQYRTVIGAASTFDTLFITVVANPVENRPDNTLIIALMDSAGGTLSDYNDTYVSLLRKFDGYELPGKNVSIGAAVVFDSLQPSEYAVLISGPNIIYQYYHPDRNTTRPLYYLNVAGGNPLTQAVRCYEIPRGDGFLYGICKSETGVVQSGITVSLCQPYDTFRVLYSQTTDASGNFTFRDIMDSEYYLKLSGGNYPIQWYSKTRSATIRYPDDFLWPGHFSGDTLLIRLSSDPINNPANGIVTVAGKVTDQSTGVPVKKARIVLFDYDPGIIVNIKQLRSPWTGMSDSTGLFVINNVPYGNYRCVAEAESLNYVAQFFPKTDLFASAKTIILTSSATSLLLDFSLRKGAQMQGKVTNVTGIPLPDAQIHCSNSENTRFSESAASSDGVWKVSGLPKGIWNVWVNHDHYLLINDTIKRTYTLTEGTTTQLPDFQLEKGGFAAGTFTAPFSLNDTSSGYDLRQGELACFPLSQNNQNAILRPEHTTGVFFKTVSTDGTSGDFYSYVIKPGRFQLLFSPRAGSDEQYMSGTSAAIIPGLGYSFVTSTASTGLPIAFAIPSGDTAKGISLALRKGYSVFGDLKNESGLLLSGNYGVDAFIKRDALFYRIAHSVPLSNGRFFLPGLVDNEDYYLQLWAEGYPDQFWSADSATLVPSQPYHFNATGYSALQLTIVEAPNGVEPGMIPGPISLWIEGDSLGMPLLSWRYTADLSIENFTLYSSDRKGTLSTVATVPATAAAATYTYRHLQSPDKFREYIVTGKGSSFLVMSNRAGFDPRSGSLTGSAPLWLDVYSNRWSIQLEWGYKKDITFTDADSVNVFRRTGDEPPKLLFRRSVGNTFFDDHVGERNDSGKTFTYYIEISGRGIVSPSVSFTLDASFFSQLPKVHTVGPYEKYQRISDAIAAAAEYDHIEVQPGVYNENISLDGKNLSINGSWNYGKPPVIDGGGAVAITVPYIQSSTERNRPRISGFSIINSAVGIRSFCPIEVEACLFDNVSVAVSMSIDSTAMVRHRIADPFTASVIDGRLKHCTFIADKPGSVVASVTARGKAEQPGYTGEYAGKEQFYITPSLSLGSTVEVDLSGIAFYESNGFQEYLPVTLQGNTSRIAFYRCNFWKTSTVSRSVNGQIAENCSALDPQFTDSTNWFMADSSPLAGMTYETRTGHDVRRFDDNGGSTDKNRPSIVKNVSAATVGLSTVLIRWSAAPANENVTHYRLYRAPGNPELYYINQDSRWDLAIAQDSLFTFIDTFSTENNAYLDTTARTGTPYLYVVAAINEAGSEGEIDLPAPPDISTYFVNKAEDRVALAAGKWHMVGTVGTEDITFAESSPHLIFGWNEKNTPDKLYAQYYRSNVLRSTKGYWIKPSTDTTLIVNQSSVTSLEDAESTVTISLEKGATGWNLVASPFPFVVKPSWLDSYNAWEWNADSLGYRKATVMLPWKAYWIYTVKDTVLTVWKKQSLSSYLAAALAKSAAKPLQWQLQLSLQSGNSYDIDNYIGILKPGLDKTMHMTSREPPDAFNGARLYLLEHETDERTSDGQSGKLAELYKSAPSQSGKLEWIVGIGASEQPSVLRIGKLTDLPEALYAFWVEKDRVINCRKQSDIVFPAQNADRFGLIVITAHPEDLALYTGNLSLHAPFPNPCRAAATIEYTIPYTWSENGAIGSGEAPRVSLTLYDIGGRQVVSIVNGHRKPGIYRTFWEGKNRSGQPVAAGMYFMKLQCGKNSTMTRFCRIR